MSEKFTLPANWSLPEEISSRFGASAGKQRLMQYAGHNLLILHRIPVAEETTRQAVLFWRSPEGSWKTTASGNGLSALSEHIESYEEVLAELDQQQDDAQSAEQLFEVMSRLNPIQRAVKNMHHCLQQLRTSLPNDKKIITLRDRAMEVERTAELLHTDCKNALDYLLARRAEDQAKQAAKISNTTHYLNTMAAIFLPVTAVASVLGANMTTGLEGHQSPTTFWIIMAAALLSGLVIQSAISKKS